MEIVKLRPIKLTKVGNTILKKDIEEIEKLYKTKTLSKLKRLGTGCFGSVYKFVASNGKEYAIKYAKKIYKDAHIQKSHDIETLLLLRENKHFPRIHAYDNTNLKDHFIVVMDYVDGIKLGNFTDNFPLAKRFISHFNKLLEYLKEKHISINDLHADNIIINRDGYPVIIDFGGLFQVEEELQMNLYGMYGYEGSFKLIQRVYDKHIEKKKTKNKNKIA